MIRNSASGHARASSHAMTSGPPRSWRPWISTPGMPASRPASRRIAPVLEERAVGSVVRADPYERQPSVVQPGRMAPGVPLGSIEIRASSQAHHSAAAVLADGPVGVGHASRRPTTVPRSAGVGRQSNSSAPTASWNRAHASGKKRPAPRYSQSMSVRRSTDHAEHDLATPARVPLGIRQGERRAPRSALTATTGRRRGARAAARCPRMRCSVVLVACRWPDRWRVAGSGRSRAGRTG